MSHKIFMNKDLEKLIEEGKDREYPIQDNYTRRGNIKKMREKYPQFSELFDDMDRANEFLINEKKKRIR